MYPAGVPCSETTMAPLAIPMAKHLCRFSKAERDIQSFFSLSGSPAASFANRIRRKFLVFAAAVACSASVICFEDVSRLSADLNACSARFATWSFLLDLSAISVP